MSLFGGSSTAAPTKSLFGAAPTSSGAPGTGASLFGGAPTASPAATTTPSAGGLFTSGALGGAFGSASTTAGGTGGLFGAKPATAPTSTAPTTSLFGNAATSNPPAGGGLFGASTTPASTPAAPTTTAAGIGSLFSSAAKPATPSLLGGPLTAQPSTTSSSLFNLAPASTQQPAATSSLFGAKPATTLQVPTINVNPPSTATSTSSSLFANPNPSAPKSLFSSGLGSTPAQPSSQTSGPAPLFSSLGAAPSVGNLSQSQQQQQQQQQVVPGVKIDISNVKPTSRFFELHEALQRDIVAADEFIQSQITLVTQCGVFIPGHGQSLKHIPADVEYVNSKYETVTMALDRDAAEISAVKEVVAVDIADAQRAFTAVEHFKMPTPFQYSQMWTPGAGDGAESDNGFGETDMVPYFDRRATEVDARLKKYAEQVREIEAHLRTVEGTAMEQMQKVMRRQAGEDADKERVVELAGAMHTFEDAVLRVASKVGETREGVIECRIGKRHGGNSSHASSSRHY